MPGIVDALRGLDLVAGRMYSVGLDFVLAGPVSLWLQGARSRGVEPLYLVVISDTDENKSLAIKAARPLSRDAPWPEEYSAIAEGRVVSVEIRGGLWLAIAADPLVRSARGEKRVTAREARQSRSYGGSRSASRPRGMSSLLEVRPFEAQQAT